jgi:putative ABC transport system permease protein
VQVAAVTNGIRSFTTTPFVFMDVDRARAYTGVPPGKATYLIIRLSTDADRDGVRRQLMSKIGDVEVLAPAEFRERSRTFWLFGTGAGAALFAGALLGVIVGTVVVAQTLYASTKEHLNEFATLRAMGSSRRYIYKVILWQALLSAVIGFAIAALVGDAVVRLTEGSALPIVITPGLMAGLFVLTLVMCIGSSIAAIVQVTRIEPAMVFTR